MKYEWRKKDKALYIPKNKPEFIDVKDYKYITIKGQGNPNGEDFSICVQTLYSMAYGIRMSYKWPEPPENYEEYTVFPLEGIWDLIDPSKYDPDHFDKDNLKYEVMIRQPDFVDQTLFDQVLEIVKKKKPNLRFDELEFKTMSEGPSIQMLHLGSYESETESFKKMEAYAKEAGYKRLYKTHKEIYLTDPKKVAPEKLKTTLRFKVDKL